MDTNILVLYARRLEAYQRIEANYHLETAAPPPLISIVSWGEIEAFALNNHWGESRMRHLHQIMAGFIVVPVDRPEMVNAYAVMDAYSRANGREIGKNDL